MSCASELNFSYTSEFLNIQFSYSIRQMTLGVWLAEIEHEANIVTHRSHYMEAQLG